MNTIHHPDVQLADGFHVTDHLDAPYRLAYEQYKRLRYTLYASDLDGSKRQQLLRSEKYKHLPSLCFSPDGTTLYGDGEHLWAKNINTGDTRVLPNLPPLDELFKRGRTIYSVDNHTLLFRQQGFWDNKTTDEVHWLKRLYRVSTRGEDLRILYECQPLEGNYDVVCFWQQGFALLHFRTYSGIEYQSTWKKLDLNTGHLEPLNELPNVEANTSFRADGTAIAWSNNSSEMYTCSLENGNTRKLPVSGTLPVWSPDGKRLAYMKDACTLAVWDVESETTQDLVWIMPHYLSHDWKDCVCAVRPVWSPDGNLLWFTLTQQHKRHFLQSNVLLFMLAVRGVLPQIKWYGALKTMYSGGDTDLFLRWKTGIVNFNTKQVMLTFPHRDSVTWLPCPAAEQG